MLVQSKDKIRKAILTTASREKLTYWALKAHVNSIKHNHELEVYRKLGEADSEHPGREHVRACEDNFMLQGPNGDHEIFIMTPLGMSLRRFQDMQQSGAFEKEFVSSATSQILLGLDFLHEADVVHSGNAVFSCVTETWII